MTNALIHHPRPGRGAGVRSRRYGALFVAGIMAAAAGIGIGTLVAPVASAETSAESLPGGEGSVSRPSVSADGRWVVAERRDGDRSTVVRTDRETGDVAELTPIPSGVRAGHSVHPIVSGDGCVVVVLTELPLDLFRDDDRGSRWDAYRTVVPECGGIPGQWELVSSAADGSARDDVRPDTPPAVSASGAVVAYRHPIAGVADATTASLVDLTVPLGDPVRVTPIVGIPAEPPTSVYRHRGVTEVAVSADGRMVAFAADTTAAASLPDWGQGVEPGGWGAPQVFVWDRADPDPVSRVQLLSGVHGAPSAFAAGMPRLSGDGRVVAFVSADPALVPAVEQACEIECPPQVFRVDLTIGPDEPGWRRLVSGRELHAAEPGAPDAGAPRLLAGDRASWLGDVNLDGSQIAFVTRATNLFDTAVATGGSAHDGDVIIAELPTGELRRVTDAITDGVPAAHANPRMSSTGRTLVFETLVPERLLDAALSSGASWSGGFASPVFGGPPVVDSSTAGPDDDDTAPVRWVVAVDTAPRLSMPSLDFGTVLVDWPSDELYVSVLNEGPGIFLPAVVTSSSPEFRITDGGTCRPGVVVTTGEICTVTVVYTPTDAVAHTGTIEVAEAARVAEVDGEQPGAGDPVSALGSPLAVSAPVAGSGGEPTLQATPAGIDVGETVVGGDPLSGGFTVANVGFLPTTIAAVVAEGAHAPEFTVVADDCSGAELFAGSTCGVLLEFRPSGAQRRTALFTITTETGEYTAVIVAGSGRYDASLVVSEPMVAPGGSIGVGVEGFPANSEVVVRFADRNRALATIRTDTSGRAVALVDMDRRERPGSRTLVAAGADGVVATVEVEVIRRPTPTPGLPGFGLG